MIDKIRYINDNEIMIIFTNRSPVTIYSSSGNALQLLDELLCPPNNAFITTYSHWCRALAASEEDTQEISLEDIA